MNSKKLSELDIEYMAELGLHSVAPPIPIAMAPIAIITIVSHLQMVVRHPKVAGSPLTQIAINATRQLQALFPPQSATYRMLELGWESQETILAEDESFDSSIGEDSLNSGEHNANPKFDSLNPHIDTDRFDENFYLGKTWSERCRDERI